MTQDKMVDIQQRLHCAAGHLNAVMQMAETDRPGEEVLHQLHAVEAALQAIGRKLVLHQVEEIETLIKNSQSPEERTAQLQRFVPLYGIAQSYSYLPSNEGNP